MIEQVRSLRQSTIAKRSNAAPLNSTKKASVKTVSVPKAGVKQPERCQIKEEACTSPKPEYHKENRRSSRHAGQTEVVPEVSVSSGRSSVQSGVEMKDEPKQECNQGEASVTSHELNCPLLSETCDSIEVKKNEALKECNIKTVSSPLFKFSNKEEHERNDSASSKMDGTVVVEEMRAKGKVEQKSEEAVTLSHEGDQVVQSPASSAPADAACTNANTTEKNLVGLSSSIDEINECNLELKNTIEVSDEAKNSLHRNEIEPLGYCKGIESNHKQLESTEFNNSNLEVVDTSTFEPENSILENAICDAPDHNSEQLSVVEGIKMDSHESANLQDDRNSLSSGISCLESKNIKSKHTKHVIHSKQNMTTNTLKKIVTAKHELIHNKTKVSIKSVKRTADEPESQQNFHRPVKVRKKQVDKDSKIHSCNYGGKSVKNQAHSILKKTQDQNLVQISKPVTHSLSDKPHGHSGCSKEPPHSAQTGHVLHPCQKQCHKPQQLAPGVKTNSHVKEELEHTGGVEHFKEEDKLKVKKTEKNLQPRQRRSSKSFSLDEPPLFIPDNIATIKREGSDHSSSFESKCMWTPSKQCGFCKKPHGNRCVSVCVMCTLKRNCYFRVGLV